jgi:vacuolar iron transporter family protein
MRRGLERELATTVAKRLTVVDPLGAHLRDELGFSDASRARPVQAGVVSAASFASAQPPPCCCWRSLARSGGRLGGRAGGAAGRSRRRAMAVTALIGRLVGAVGL